MTFMNNAICQEPDTHATSPSRLCRVTRQNIRTHWKTPHTKRAEGKRRAYNFRSNIESDVAFTVGSSGKLFKAHKCVLALSSATLYELVLTKSNDNNEESHEINITLADIDKTVFEKILEFIYTGECPDISRNDEESVKDLFLTADRFDCTDLKLYAESVLIEKHLVSSNAAEMILSADFHSCALLKEASMNEYATDPKIVMASEGGWSKLTGIERSHGRALGLHKLRSQNVFIRFQQ